MTNTNQQPEVIEPHDPRYKRPEDFNHEYAQHTHHVYTHSFGCTPIGCLPGCLFSIIVSILLTVLLNLLF
ncbi:hypothetical protein [Staphylococcus americanisciuri]|uniref:Uncharacterized protein n=1 Tax=Staphylococcus americanisciuri TaxID=2973940 RepID=A0ABT2F3D2_9STAP|nr:hypothetical protein [Staphylococcus americanisciuri]MCS4486875.1 hypothetical protein [Staphylococcus americanisciuri]